MQDFSKKTSQIENLARKSPQELVDHLAATHRHLTHVAPNIDQALQGVAIRGMQFLNSKVPRPASQYPSDGVWEPSPSQKQSFLHYHEAVNEPIKALEHVKNGTLTTHHMEALQAVHPELLKEMQNKVMENMTPQNMKRVSYSTKIALSKFLGSPIASSMTPEAVMANQANFAAPPALAPAGTPKRKSSTLGGLEKLNIAQRSATETQKEEEEG